jgi:periplasmic divalent cation tolerance protein
VANINPVELVLTCGSWQEARKIADALLDKRLIICAEFIEIKSKYWWKSELESRKEIRLVMHSLDKFFDEVETEVKKLHSYDVFTLQAVPLTHISKEAKQWLIDESKQA